MSPPPQARHHRDLRLPEPDKVHVWVANLGSASHEAARWLTTTTNAERERASRFYRREDGERYLMAHGALRLLLSDYLTCDPLALRFAAHENGKPFLEGARLEFNLSHSGALALIAVAVGRPVGVDVEQLRAMPDLDGLVARICTPDESATLAGLAERERERAFFAMWTRKEALAKATGEGIAGVFRDTRRPSDETQARWTLTEMSDLPGYAACVAAEGAGWELVRRTML